MKANTGKTYIVTSSTGNICKAGYWTGTIKSLRSRYVSYYGSDLEINYVNSKYPHVVERKFKTAFKKSSYYQRAL